MLSSRLLAQPLLLCAFRPFFLFSLLCALLALLARLAFLAGWGWLPAVPGGALVWHAHELLFGFATALRSATQGRAGMVMQFRRCDVNG